MKFTYKPSPNYRQPQSTQSIMRDLTIGLLVVYAFALFYYFTNDSFGTAYGIRAIILMIVGIASCVITEVIWNLVKKQPLSEIFTSSFPIVTAIILVLIVPINTSYYALAVSSIISIFFGKLLFGGFGQNIFNPAGIGRAIVLSSFAGSIAVDVVTGATPVQTINSMGWIVKDPSAVETLLGHFGGLPNLFVGFYPGAIGETSALVILLVGVFLAVRKVIDWRIPVVYISSIFLMTLIVGLMNGAGVWYPLYHILTGGVMFGAVFMLTDPVTNPTSASGRVIFALGAAFFTVLIRLKANLPEGVVFSILIMNMLTPMIESFTDGQQIRSLKKYRQIVVGLVVVAFAIITFTGTTLEAKEVEIVDNTPVTEESVLKNMFPKVSTEEISFEDETGLIDTVYQAGDAGYAYKVTVRGFQDDITFMVGISTEGELIGYEVLYVNDTPGIGDQVSGSAFQTEVVGKTTTDSISTISGATISSEAVIKGINAAKAHFNGLMGIEGGEPEKPALNLGNPVAIEATTYKGEIIETTVDGDETTFIVEVNGYGMIEGGGADHGYSRNQFKVVVNTAENQIVSVEYTKFGDTANIGDKTMNEEYYALFSGLSTEDYSQEVDTVSTATITSKSMISAIRIVLDALNQ